MNLVTLIRRSLTACLLAMVLGPSAPGSETSPAPANDTLPAKVVLRTKRPLVIGHRGYPTVAPENSLASFHQALQAGVDLVELDYHHSLDGIPVVIHDGTLDRTTDSATRWSEKGIRVDSRPASELVTLGVGGGFQPPFLGERLPTLAAALEFIQKRGITLVERKSGDPATLAALLKEKGLVNRVVVQSFDWGFLAAFHRLLPDQVLGALGPRSVRGERKLADDEKALSTSWLREVLETGARIAVWNGQVDGASVEEAHRLGLAVWVYTINDADRARALIRLGVDGIITDNAALVWRAMAIQALDP